MIKRMIYCVFALFCMIAISSAYADTSDTIQPLKDAAEQGNSAAQCLLGFMYKYGEGVAMDYKQAAHWFKKAAEQGDVEAQRVLGIMYYNGDGIAKDYKQAAHWFKKAAEQGNDDAQRGLGIMYYNGDGIAKNKVYAYVFLNQAAITNEKAKVNRDLIEKTMTPQEIARAQSMTIQDVLK